VSPARSTDPRSLANSPDISDDSLILPKWIEAAQKRTLERTRGPIIAADITRFGEDETVIMRRKVAGYGCTALITRPTR
jgi:hypothetical protein